MSEKIEHDHYVHFPYRYNNAQYPSKLGYICIGAKKDGEHVFLTIAGSACSVSEYKFLPRRGIGYAMGRVNCNRPHIKKIETTREEVKNLSFSEIINRLELRPTCEFMDEACTVETNKRWNTLRMDEGQEYLEAALADLDELVDGEL